MDLTTALNHFRDYPTDLENYTAALIINIESFVNSVQAQVGSDKIPYQQGLYLPGYRSEPFIPLGARPNGGTYRYVAGKDWIKACQEGRPPETTCRVYDQIGEIVELMDDLRDIDEPRIIKLSQLRDRTMLQDRPYLNERNVELTVNVIKTFMSELLPFCLWSARQLPASLEYADNINLAADQHDLLFAMIRECIGHDSSHIYSIRRQGLDIVIRKHVDFRIWWFQNHVVKATLEKEEQEDYNDPDHGAVQAALKAETPPYAGSR